MNDTNTAVDFETQYTIGEKYALRLSSILLEHSAILKCEHCSKILKQAIEIMNTATTTTKERQKD